jgi:lipopolysaccharide/colanic/teichoic acid biosynthesis glycosyltransferase
MLKRVFDVVVSAGGLLLLSPALILAAVLVKLTSQGPAMFKQVRVGRDFEPFEILKFRTMVVGAPNKGPAITVGNDARITRVGSFLRKTKLDEFPQLINVLKGEMSLVGPRPEVPRYVEMFREEYAEVLTVRPGITDLASLQFRHESELLAEADDPEAEYCNRVLPEKLRLAKDYIERSSLLFDLKVILQTIVAMFSTRAEESRLGESRLGESSATPK